MQWTGAQSGQTVAMRSRAVAFVLTEAIVRIQRIERPHHPVPMHLGDNRCGTDGGNFRITTNDGITIPLAIIEYEVRQPVAVDLNQRGHQPQPQQRASHGQERCLQNIQTIDFGRVTYENDFLRTLGEGGAEVTDTQTIDSGRRRSARLIVARYV